MALSDHSRRYLQSALANQGVGNEVADILEAASVLSGAEAALIDGVTAGTTEAGKAISLDSNNERDGIGVLKKADVLISSASVLTLNATPVELVAAPGAGKYLVFEGIRIFLDFNSAAYAAIAAGEDLSVKYKTASGAKASADIEATGFLDATADALAIGTRADTAVAESNAALVLHLLTGEVTTGDSPLKIQTLYREVRTAALEAIA